ncbi:hypothetical protein [Rivularia sp. UHCC 0363]|uniref:hypothetical protein n=1 Tax=Rivularia sp. UHCC 0363 TaxID=3110244 RepID=UPI002B20D10B|nr:hypothetical protein [Rivularia sp. UHCC 0363]MEA5593313.1 hypothetical protein [Rivularia sp. UHCC 0363]
MDAIIFTNLTINSQGQTIMTNVTLQDLKDNIYLAMIEDDDEKLIDLLNKSGLIEAAKIQITIDINKIQPSENAIKAQIQEDLEVDSKEMYELATCYYCFINGVYKKFCGGCYCCP